MGPTGISFVDSYIQVIGCIVGHMTRELRSRTVVTLGAAAAVAVALLAGCAPTPTLKTTGAPSATPTASASATPTPTPTPTAAAITDPNALFTISAKLTSGTGATATILQTVYKPVATLPDLAAVQSQLDTQCTGWRDTYPTADYVVSTITATDTSTGGKSWGNGHIVVSMDGSPVFTGDASSFQAYCASVQLAIPGTIRGVTPVPAGAGSDDPLGWATINYGFGFAYDSTHPDTPQPGDSTISNCVVTLSQSATASALATSWLTRTQYLPDFLCDVNH